MLGMLSVVTLVLALVFIAVEAGLGALRGTKRELWRIGSLILIGLILFFIVPGIGKSIVLAVANMISPMGSTFPEVAGWMAVELGLDASVGSAIETILALVVSLLIPFVFVTLFWVFKLLSWPIFAIVWLFVNKCRKAQQENVQVESKDTVNETADTEQEAAATTENVSVECNGAVTTKVSPTLTDRLVGAAIGAVAGLFLGALTFMPLAQLNKTVALVEKTVVAEMAGEEVADMVGFWSEAPAGGIYRMTGLESLFGLMYDSLAKVKVGDRVYRAEELNEVLVLASEAIVLASEVNDKGLVAVAEPLKEAVQSLLNLKLLAEEEKLALIQYLAKTGLSESAESNSLVASLQTGIETMSLKELEEDALGAIDLMVLLDQYGVKSVDDFEHLDLSIFTAEFIDESAEAIYRLNLAEQLLPAAIDTVLETALSDLDVTVVPCGEIADFDNTKQDFKDLLGLMTKLVDLAEDAEKLTTMGEVKDALKEVAKLKESPFISAETYANLESCLIKNVVSTAKVEETIHTAVKEHMEAVKQNVSEDVEIDDETVEKMQEAVTNYLNNSEEVKVEEIDNVITKLDEGTLMENIDASVVEDIKSGNFDLSDWISKLDEVK